jgi:hypothetical protein
MLAFASAVKDSRGHIDSAVFMVYPGLGRETPTYGWGKFGYRHFFGKSHGDLGSDDNGKSNSSENTGFFASSPEKPQRK